MSKFSMDFSKLLGQIDSVQTKKSYEADVNLWKPTKDKSGNAAAVIRFLPSININDFPFVRMYRHSFKEDPARPHAHALIFSFPSMCLWCKAPEYM